MTNIEAPSCPINHELLEDGPNSWMAETSQSILDNPENTELSLFDLKTRLDDHYSLMREHSPGKAAVNIARKVRSAARGPIGAILNAYAIDIYNGLDYEQQQKLIEKAAKEDVEYRSTNFNAAYTGNAQSWMRTLVHLHDEATLIAISEDEQLKPVFSNIKKADAFIYDSMVEAYKLDDDEEKVVYWSDWNLDWDIAETSRDNRAAAFRLMFSGYLALAGSDELDPSNPNQIANAMHDNIDSLSRLASTNRSTSGGFLPRLDNPGNPVSPRLFEIEGKDADVLDEKFEYADGFLVPLHPSITAGSWRSPGNCAGNFRLRLPSQRLTDSIDDFFDHIGQPDFGTDKDDKFSPVQAFTALGIEIGRHTLFKPEGSPALARLAIYSS